MVSPCHDVYAELRAEKMPHSKTPRDVTRGCDVVERMISMDKKMPAEFQSWKTVMDFI